jgi:hypothetical protein
MALTERDAAVILRVFQCRAVPAQATYLFARAFDRAGGGDNWSKRLRLLYDAGWLSRFYLPQSQYIAGSQWPVYFVESGVAAQAAELRRPWRAIDRPTRARLAAASSGARDQVFRLLTGRFGLDAEIVVGGLRASTDLALKLYSGDPCQIQHVLLNSTLLSILWYGLDEEPTCVRPDGSCDLSEPGGVPLLPDTFFSCGQTAICIEAETGASNRAKIRAKITRYLDLRTRLDALSARLAMPFDRLRVLFHCATPGHKRMIANLIAEQAPRGTGVFLLSDSTSLHLNFPQPYFRRNTALPVQEGGGEVAFYEVLYQLTRRAIFAQVEGSNGNDALLGYLGFNEAIVREV